MRTYNLFISHSWDYSDAYQRLKNILNNAPYFDYKDYSVPKEDPLLIRNARYYKSELANKIENQMKNCSAILILAGVYASYSDSIQMEIDIARSLKKPIIAIECWGSEKTSTVVKQNATKIVRWNTSSIVGAIREVAL